MVSRPRDLSTFEESSRPVDTRDIPPDAASEIDATRADFRFLRYLTMKHASARRREYTSYGEEWRRRASRTSRARLDVFSPSLRFERSRFVSSRRTQTSNRTFASRRRPRRRPKFPSTDEAPSPPSPSASPPRDPRVSSRFFPSRAPTRSGASHPRRRRVLFERPLHLHPLHLHHPPPPPPPLRRPRRLFSSRARPSSRRDLRPWRAPSPPP